MPHPRILGGALMAVVFFGAITPVVLDFINQPTSAERHATDLAHCALHGVKHGAEAADARRRCADLLGSGQ